MTPDWNIVMHLAEAAAMIIFGVGAWSAQRKAGETTNATDIDKVESDLGKLAQVVAKCVRWEDFNRENTNIREVIKLTVDPVCDRVEKLENKVFNGSHRG